ncbi:MAG TPA: hypothetical protein VFV64_06710 [Permianibacter sp.]|nr:hypothetical protein [Permianibacter sp.]
MNVPHSRFNPSNLQHVAIVNAAIATAGQKNRGRIRSARAALNEHGIELMRPEDDIRLERLVIDLSEWR